MEKKEFLEDGVTPNPNFKKEEAKKGGEGEGQPKTFVQDDVDKIVSSRVNEVSDKLSKKFEERLQKEREEWERQSKLSEEQRAKELSEKQKEALAAKERELTLKENTLDGKAKLDELKIPSKFIKYLINEDKDEMFKNIEEFNSEFVEAVKNGVAEQIKSDPPKDVNKSGNSNTTMPTQAFL